MQNGGNKGEYGSVFIRSVRNFRQSTADFSQFDSLTLKRKSDRVIAGRLQTADF
jgi:hypothetical protein